MRLKTRTMRSIKPPKGRLVIILLIFGIACAVFFGRLFNLQFASKELYSTGFANQNSSVEEIRTVRGEICDRNGVALASNSMTNSITLDKNLLPRGKENSTVLAIARFFSENSIPYRDILPVTSGEPYDLKSGFSSDAEMQKYVRNYAKYMGLEYDKLVEDGFILYKTLLSRYGLDKFDCSETDKRIIAGIRFTADVNAFSTQAPCTLVENASPEIIGLLSDSFHLYPGLAITGVPKRVYNIPGLASHLLGRTGPIFAEDAALYREKGYSLNETVGKEGAEYAFEEHLRGINGKKRVTVSEDGLTVLAEEITVESKPGSSVYLTIDAEMQAVAEESLERIITEQARVGNLSPKKYDGEDANAGVVVVMDPRDGAVRTIANYPSYDLNTYSEDIAVLSKDTENTPLVNRATSGLYEPGSTFKIATAAASLHYGVTDFNEVIKDLGEYNFHATYKPHCWIYDSKGITHGEQTVVDAIMNSCNYYFFEMGVRLGIDKINSYAKSLGLGVRTGIETGESAGILVSPQYMEANGLAWNPGYVLQAAIGQQHLFTPVQITSYICTFLNGGKRYKTHIFDSARDYSTGEIISEYTPEILSDAEIPQYTVDRLKEAMKRVVDDGTASSTFLNYKYSVGGKTGTAQVSGGSDNVIFVGFAPYENPEIVVTVILEHGDLSRNAAMVAKDIFDCYFKSIYPEDFEKSESLETEETEDTENSEENNGEGTDAMEGVA